MSYASVMDFTKEVLNFMSLLASTVFNDSYGVQDLPLLGLVMQYEKWGVYWIKNSENWVTQVQVMSYWTLMCLPWPLTFIIHFKVYRMCIWGQHSGLSVILNQVMLHWLWTRLLNHLGKESKTYLFLVTLKANGFCLNVIYFAFISITTHLVNFIESVEVILS